MSDNRDEMRAWLDAIGRNTLAKEMGRTVNAVGMALMRGRFPAAWWPTAVDVGRRAGRLPAEHWFNFQRQREPAE